MPLCTFDLNDLGCRLDPKRTAEIIAERTERGDLVMCTAFASANQPSLPGHWALLKSQGIKGVFLRDAEPKILGGKHRRAFLQRRGTCVSRGLCRGAQTSLDFDIAERFGLSQVVELAFAQIYADARHLGGDTIGGDGAILSEAAKAIHDLGIAPAVLFPGMTEDQQEALAVQMAAVRAQTPAAWHTAASGHTAATFWPETKDMISDTIASGYAVPYAGSYVTGQPNAAGISDLGSYGPHCRYLSCVYIDENGDDQWGSSESWGRFPAGDPHDEDQTMPVDQIPVIKLRYADGILKSLAPGEVGVKAARFYEMIRNGGEAWGIGPARGFTSDQLADIAKTISVG